MASAATIKDIARAAGVSSVTVSRALNAPDLVRAETRVRVENAIRRLGYTPNLAARAMRTQTTRTIGFVVPNILSHSNAAVAQAAERTLGGQGYGMMLVSSGYDVESGLRALDTLRNHRVDGTLVYLAEEDQPQLVEALKALDGPCVVLDRSLRVEADTVLSEHARPMKEAVGYLASLGHAAITLVLPDQAVRPVRERCRAFAEATVEAGLPADARRIVAVRSEDVAQFSAAGLLDAVPRPTALVVNGSQMLRRVLDALRQRELAVPDDVSIVGLDVEEVAPFVTPELTRIVRDFDEIGRTAAEFLVNRLRDRDRPRQTTVFDSHVILKSSCAAARPA